MPIGRAGLEPARAYAQQILSLGCLPIPPPSRRCSLRGSNTPQANYEFAAFTRLLKEQGGSCLPYRLDFNTLAGKASSGYWFDSKIVVVPTASIVTYPLPFPKDVTVFFTIGKKFVYGLMVGWRSVFSSLTIVLRPVGVNLVCDTSWFVHLSPALLGPAAGHVATINQIRHWFLGIVMSCQDPSQPRRISVPVMIHGKDTAVL